MSQTIMTSNLFYKDWDYDDDNNDDGDDDNKKGNVLCNIPDFLLFDPSFSSNRTDLMILCTSTWISLKLTPIYR